MSRSRNVMLVLVGFVALSCATAIAQNPVAQTPPPGGATTPSPMTYFDGTLYGLYGGSQSEAAKLAKDFTKSTKPDEKQELRKKLGDLLTKQFDANVQQQQKELEEVEKQISELRNLLKKRQDAKASIVERRIEQLIQDAEGLGWTAPGTNVPRAMMGGGAFGGGLRPGTAPRPTEAAR